MSLLDDHPRLRELVQMPAEERSALIRAMSPEGREAVARLLTALKDEQALAFDWLDTQKHCISEIERLREVSGTPEVLYGGAMGGGKSWFIAAYVTQQAEQNPGASYYVCRKELKAFRNTTLVSFIGERWTSDGKSGPGVDITHRPGWKHRKSDCMFVHANGATILYGALASDDDRDRIKSMNLTGAAIDESSEVERTSAQLLKARCSRNNAGKPFMLHASNPEPCWLEDFTRSPKKGQSYVPSMPMDNKHLSGGYIDQLRETYSDTPELFEAYINGVWGVIGTTDAMFDKESLVACQGLELPAGDITWGVDVARFGDDTTVCYEVNGGAVRLLTTFAQSDTRQTADALGLLYRTSPEPLSIRVDDIGVGGGVVDNLVSAGLPVIGVGAAEKAIDSDKFFNRRAEMYWNLRTLVRDRKVSLPNDPDLVSELLATKYEIRSGRILVIPKARIKKSLGRSPDKADALVLALAPVKEQRRYPILDKPTGW